MLKLRSAITERTIVALAKNCLNLEVLDLDGCTGITTSCIDAFSGHKCLRFLILLRCSSDDLRGSAFESLAFGCPSLESIVLFMCDGAFELTRDVVLLNYLVCCEF
ncbi:hypothetical protein ACLB2K_064436 [Fragaria x ananassa]